RSLDVVGHHRGASGTLGPEPDEGHRLRAAAVQHVFHLTLHQQIDSNVDWPRREHDPFPVAEPNTLKMLAHTDRQYRPEQVVGASRGFSFAQPPGRRLHVAIAL